MRGSMMLSNSMRSKMHMYRKSILRMDTNAKMHENKHEGGPEAQDNKKLDIKLTLKASIHLLGRCLGYVWRV